MAKPILRLIQEIPISGVFGRLDHLAYDPSGKRMFLSCLGHNSVTVIDTFGGVDNPKKLLTIKTPIKGLFWNRGLLYIKSTTSFRKEAFRPT